MLADAFPSSSKSILVDRQTRRQLTAATSPIIFSNMRRPGQLGCAGGVGVATQAYWQLLLAQVKPLPRFFSQLDFAVAAEAAKVIPNLTRLPARLSTHACWCL